MNSGEENIVAKTTPAQNNASFNIFRNHQDVYNSFYGRERFSEMFAVPCSDVPDSNTTEGTYWVAYSLTSDHLRMPPAEDGIAYCTAAGNDPGILDPQTSTCNPQGTSWNYFERRLQANSNDSIVIQAHYPIPDASGVVRDTNSYFSLTSVTIASGPADQFNSRSTVQLDDVQIWGDDVDRQSTYLITTISTADARVPIDLFSIAPYSRFSEIRFTGANRGPIAIVRFVPDMSWFDD